MHFTIRLTKLSSVEGKLLLTLPLLSLQYKPTFFLIIRQFELLIAAEWCLSVAKIVFIHSTKIFFIIIILTSVCTHTHTHTNVFNCHFLLLVGPPRRQQTREFIYPSASTLFFCQTKFICSSCCAPPKGQQSSYANVWWKVRSVFRFGVKYSMIFYDMRSLMAKIRKTKLENAI